MATKTSPGRRGFLIMITKTAYLFLNGEFAQDSNPIKLRHQDDVIIAVDGGLHHLAGMGESPHIIIGDLDSVEPDLLKSFQNISVEIRKFPSEKNETDFELALDLAVQMGVEKIVIFGALGGRIDHTIANISLISSPRFLERDIRILNGAEELFFIKAGFKVYGKAGDLISLLPWGCEAEGVSTTGLKYQLMDETLYPDRSRGMSNVMLSDSAVIDCRKGKLLCVHTSFS